MSYSINNKNDFLLNFANLNIYPFKHKGEKIAFIKENRDYFTNNIRLFSSDEIKEVMIHPDWSKYFNKDNINTIMKYCVLDDKLLPLLKKDWISFSNDTFKCYFELIIKHQNTEQFIQVMEESKNNFNNLHYYSESIINVKENQFKKTILFYDLSFYEDLGSNENLLIEVVKEKNIKFNEITSFSFLNKLSDRSKKIILSHYAKKMIQNNSIESGFHHRGVDLELIKEIEKLDKKFFLEIMNRKILCRAQYSQYDDLISPEYEITKFQDILMNVRLDDEQKEILKNLYENYPELFHEPIIKMYGVIEEKTSFYNMVAKTFYNAELIENVSVFINYLSEEERLNMCGFAINHYLNETIEKIPEFVFQLEKENLAKLLENAEKVYSQNESLKVLKAEYLNRTLSLKANKILRKI